MITNRPWASPIPWRRAAPYPRTGTSITRAPASVASWIEPSVEPLSATSTSPHTFARRSQSLALATQVTIVSASSRHGIRIVSSRHGVDAVGGVGPVTAGDTTHDRAPDGRDAPPVRDCNGSNALVATSLHV